ncbi:MAG: AtpZ/AtpI family protein [Deltaproteobacteria bacterium]|nr:AtpZ/AtpI family protein [Deltaproteobacteria bacterium]MBK7066290.1 AtpZ/AtpI family protein [Deltaproteobacteria bacterium]MBK8691295.1 AtpZ/AtpI family protein [Deltaproteobacteria bacterium]MBP6833340.1 AtpZ/AtpI family protein [Deltaproteobacteria bacterium]
MKLPLRDMVGLSLGLEFVISIVVMAGLGRWIDSRYHTEPTFLLVGFAIGAAAGFRSMYRFATRDDPKPEEPKKNDPKPPTTP